MFLETSLRQKEPLNRWKTPAETITALIERLSDHDLGLLEIKISMRRHLLQAQPADTETIKYGEPVG